MAGMREAINDPSLNWIDNPIKDDRGRVTGLLERFDPNGRSSHKNI
jgi:hypothetical protein